MLAGIERSDEVFAMQMLRSGDQHRVNALVLQEMPVIQVCFCRWRDFRGFLETPGVNVGGTYDFRIRALERLFHELLTTRTRADDSNPNAVIRSQRSR